MYENVTTPNDADTEVVCDDLESLCSDLGLNGKFAFLGRQDFHAFPIGGDTKASKCSNRNQEFAPNSSGINSSLSEECLLRADTATSHATNEPASAKDCRKSFLERSCLLLERPESMAALDSCFKDKPRRPKPSSVRGDANRLAQELDHYIHMAIERRNELYRAGQLHKNLTELVGLEQQIIGGVCFYKTYR